MNIERSEPALSKLELEIAERKARRFWITLIVSFLGLQVALGVVAVTLATGDPTAAIIPDYYQSAVNWDTTRRARQLTDELGWSIEVVVGETNPEIKQRLVKVAITDADGGPVEELNLAGKLFHHARGAEIYPLRFDELKPGVYATTTSLIQTGVWQMDLSMDGIHGFAADSRELIVSR